VDTEGILTVTAKDTITGKEVQSQITGQVD